MNTFIKRMFNCLIVIVLFMIIILCNIQQNNDIVITIVGDIMLSRGVQQYLDKEGYAYPYDKVRSFFLEDDFTIANLECPITESNYAAYKEKKFIFKADTANAAALLENGIDCANLANNHTMDYMAEGLKDTLEILHNVGINTVGAGFNSEDATTYVFEKNGYRIGILAFSAFPAEGFFYNKNDATVSYASIYNTEEIAHKIKSLECDYKIVYFHWGKEYDHIHSDRQEMYAHIAIDAGADFVVGSHPHVLQDKEWYNGKPVYYSLGNFIFDRQIQSGTDDTVILQLTLDKNGLKNIKEIPAKIKYSQVLITENQY